MSTLLKRLMGNIRYMAPKEDDAGGEGGGGNADDIDNDLDLDDDDDIVDAGKKEDPKDKPKVGEQDDGSVIVELEEGDGKEKVEGEGTDEEAEREKIRESRRKERHDRKLRQKEREESTKRELQAERQARKDLEARLNAIEGKDRSREIAQIDETIKQTAQSYNYHKEQLKIAHEQHDGTAAADATEKMLSARDRFNQLKTVKEGFEKSQKQPTQNLDPRLVGHANAFMRDHSWYKPDGNDMDTKITRTIDDSLAEEGWDPKTPEYWEELRARIKKVLPHRVAGGKVATTDTPAPAGKQLKSVVSGNGGESQAPSSKGTFSLSAERVSALKEAGMWNDPKQRADAIKRFREFDKANKG